MAKLDGLSPGTIDRPSGAGKRLVIVHAGSCKGFVSDALLVFEGAEADGDYHKNMNYTIFEQWFKNSLIPQLPSNSVIVMDNAPYHNRHSENYPTSKWRKNQLQDWLRSKSIEFSMDMLKPELWKIVKLHRSKFPEYICDDFAETKGHTVLRLPPYHSDLNPIEMVWSIVKGHVAKHNTTYKLADVRKLLLEGVAGVTSDQWAACCRHAETTEDEFWRLDGEIDQEMDEVIIEFSDDDDADEQDQEVSDETSYDPNEN